MGKVSIVIRRTVYYSKNASDVKEDIATSHPRGREIILAVEAALSKDAKKGAKPCGENKFVRAIYPQPSPQLVIAIVFEIESTCVQITNITTNFS